MTAGGSTIHTISSISIVVLVLVMDLQHFLNESLILPRLILAVKIVIKRLSADLQSFTVKADIALDLTVIGLYGNEFQPFLLPNF